MLQVSQPSTVGHLHSTPIAEAVIGNGLHFYTQNSSYSVLVISPNSIRVQLVWTSEASISIFIFYLRHMHA